jgi:hypothetical protein
VKKYLWITYRKKGKCSKYALVMPSMTAVTVIPTLGTQEASLSLQNKEASVSKAGLHVESKRHLSAVIAPSYSPTSTF